MASPTTSSTTTTLSSTGTQPENMKHPMTTTIKLDGANYLVWAQSVKVFIASQMKERHLTDDPPDPFTTTWRASDSCVMVWLMNSMNIEITTDIMFLKTAKAIWNHVKYLYSYEQNLSRIGDIYTQLFALEQGTWYLQAYYSNLCRMFNELDLHQPLIKDLTVLRRYHEELRVTKFLAGLGPTLLHRFVTSFLVVTRLLI